MRMSKLFSQTIRETPSDAEIPSHQLLLRAGFIRPLANGIFTYLTLAKKSLSKIENIMREEINAIGGQEISMPVVSPAEILIESGRWYKISSEMRRFMDKINHSMVLSMTHEEVISDLVRNEIHSYRQLPQLLYQIQTKWRDDPHPRAGLIRAREFTMNDSYSLDADWEGLNKQYEAHYHAYEKIFLRCKLPVIPAISDSGIIGGQSSHGFIYLTSMGDDTVLICDHCGYTANQQIAKTNKIPITDESLLSIEKIATPDSKTINDLSSYLSIPTNKTAKAVFLVATFLERNEKVDRFVFSIVRGDMDVNETKLSNAINALAIRPATDSEIYAIGAVPGYASPVGLNDVLIIVDDLIPLSSNLVSGANIEGYHFRNVNYDRDYKADFIADITLAHEGDGCIECNYPLRSICSVEVGRISKLGTHLSEAMGCYYLDKHGQSHPIVMGSYGIGSGRLLSCIAEEHHDEHGLKWPISVSPYQIHLVSLPWKNQNSIGDDSNMAEQLYQKLLADDIDCLFDDREESPGVKFNDADLIGIPIRLTISERSIKNGGVEYKRRDQMNKSIIPIENIIPTIQMEIRLLETE